MRSIAERLKMVPCRKPSNGRSIRIGAKKRTEARPGDRTLLLIALALGLLGLMMVYSASGIRAAKTHQDSIYFLKKQLLWMGLGFSLSSPSRPGWRSTGFVRGSFR